MPNSSDSLSRRERERLRRRRAMLRAAQSVFAEKGYARATLDEIAERAEFGKGTLYNYFEGGKEGLLFAIFDDIYDDLCNIIRQTFAPGSTTNGAAPVSLRDAYHTLVMEVFAYYQRREDVFLILVKEAYRLAFSDDADKAQYFQEQYERMVSALVPAIERAIDEGKIRKQPPYAVAHMLFENLDGVVVHRCMAERDDGLSLGEEIRTNLSTLHDPEAAADFLTSMLFDGLQVNPQSAPAQSGPTDV